jgi:hypothetical protein
MSGADEETIRQGILNGVMSLWQGGIMELRSLKTPYGTISGFFDDPILLAESAFTLDCEDVPGTYVTLNPIDPSLFALAPNLLRKYAKETTQDKDILRRAYLLIDLDAKRKSGISATDEQHDAALDCARLINADFAALGWARPRSVDSGNGAHLIYRIDLPNDKDAQSELRAFLKSLGSKYDDESVQVDQTVFNAARIVKLPGTMARKGADMPDRPHRRSHLLDLPGDKSL